MEVLQKWKVKNFPIRVPTIHHQCSNFRFRIYSIWYVHIHSEMIILAIQKFVYVSSFLSSISFVKTLQTWPFSLLLPLILKDLFGIMCILKLPQVTLSFFSESCFLISAWDSVVFCLCLVVSYDKDDNYIVQTPGWTFPVCK